MTKQQWSSKKEGTKEQIAALTKTPWVNRVALATAIFFVDSSIACKPSVTPHSPEAQATAAAPRPPEKIKNPAHELRKKRLKEVLGLISEHIDPNFSNDSLKNLTALDEKALAAFFREHASQPGPNTIFWRLSIGPEETVPLNITMLYNKDLANSDAKVFQIILNTSNLNDPRLENKPGFSTITQTGIENFTLHHVFQLPNISWKSDETEEAKMFSGGHPDGRFFELRAGKDGSWSFLRVSHPANAPIKSR